MIRNIVRAFSTGTETAIRAKLRQLEPAHVQVLNESAAHRRGTESHFNVLVVASRFEGLSRIEKHQLVYELLA